MWAAISRMLPSGLWIAPPRNSSGRSLPTKYAWCAARSRGMSPEESSTAATLSAGIARLARRRSALPAWVQRAPTAA